MTRGRRELGQALGAAAALRVLAGGRLHARGGVVFAYHDIGPAPCDIDFFVTSSMLREHLELAREGGLRFVGLDSFIAVLIDGGSVDGLGVVTFDDALLGLRHHALDVLDDAGITATVFVVADALGSDPWWYPGSKRVLTARELQEVVDAGHRVGSHTLSHPSLPSLDDARLRTELADSRAKLEDLVGLPVDALAYPSGHHDARVREFTARAGYRAGLTFFNGRVTPSVDPLRLPRLTMSSRHSRARLVYHLARPSWSWPDHQIDVPGDDAAQRTRVAS